MKIPLIEIRKLEDEEYIEIAAIALWLEEREREIIKEGVLKALAIACGADKR